MALRTGLFAGNFVSAACIAIAINWLRRGLSKQPANTSRCQPACIGATHHKLIQHQLLAANTLALFRYVQSNKHYAPTARTYQQLFCGSKSLQISYHYLPTIGNKKYWNEGKKETRRRNAS
jgi:putative component of membrane protein insertase Oxa1/YidC/SpoIIIJ protein YidD